MSFSIVTPDYKFTLLGDNTWTRTIENTGGYPIIKYKASHPYGPGSLSIVQWEIVTKYGPTGEAWVSEEMGCLWGTEILVIGDTIHFPTAAVGLLMRNYRPLPIPT